MDKAQAIQILLQALDRYRRMTYSDLKALVEENTRLENTYYEEIDSGNGSTYQIRINVYWDDKKTRTIRVLGAIDDGGWRAMIPICESFIIDSTGNFIDE